MERKTRTKPVPNAGMSVCGMEGVRGSRTRESLAPKNRLCDRPIRVALISPSMGRYGGLEGFVLTVAGAVSRKPGFSVRVIFKEVGAFSLEQDLSRRIEDIGVTIEFAQKLGRPLWSAIFWADLVHAQNLPPDVLMIANLLRKPVLATIHARSTGRRTIRQKLWYASQRLAKRRFYVSEFVRRSWEGATVKPGSSVVHSICQLASSPAPWDGRCGFAFVSRFIANKGLEQLLPAYHAANLDPDRWPLHLVGEGPFEAWVDSFVDTNGMRGVHRHGFVEESVKHRIMGGAKFVVVPPNTQEDFGLVPLEARSLRVPCLITRDGGVPEAAGQHCLSCEPGDVEGIAELLRQAAAMPDEEYRRLATEAHQSLAGELVRPEFYAGVYREMAGYALDK